MRTLFNAFIALVLVSTGFITDTFRHSSGNPTPEQHYATYCSGCHGEQMNAFVDRKWVYGNSRDDLFKAIKFGYAADGMPAYDTTFTDAEIMTLVDYIQEGIKNVDRYVFDQKPRPQVFESDGFAYRLDTVAKDLEVPWGFEFLPNDEMIITDRNGTIYRKLSNGKLKKIKGGPEVVNKGQGGLLDVALHPDFENNNLVYFTYSKRIIEGDDSLQTTAILRGKLEGNQIRNTEDIFIAEPALPTRHHYGSRLQFDRKGFLYFSVGDRGRRDENPQALDNHCGKIHRIHDDGSIPEDNPFVNTPGAMPTIYSYGHRNPQGMALHPETGEIWTNEHGPRGGDEINVIRPGLNYGWPVISYGINYNGTTFTNLTEKEGMEQPVHYWVPSIGVCGMAFITGSRYPEWKGQLLSGSLRFKYLNLSILDGEHVVEEKMLLKNIGRVREVHMGPDDYIYISVEWPGAIYRLVPEGA